MLIQLTNANSNHKGNPILINTDLVLSIYRSIIVREDKSVEDISYIFCPPHGSWEVYETPEEIMALITGKKPSVKVSTRKNNGN